MRSTQMSWSAVSAFSTLARLKSCVPSAKGRIDYVEIRKLITEIGFGGYITIEQERDPRNTGSVSGP